MSLHDPLAVSIFVFIRVRGTSRAVQPRALLLLLRCDVLENLAIGITELNGNVTLFLGLELNGVNTGERADHGGLTVSDMTDGSNIDCGLAGNNLRGHRGQAGNVNLSKTFF